MAAGEVNLYLLKQDKFDGYDTYDSCVVAASSIHDAKQMRPDNGRWVASAWPPPEFVSAQLIGEAREGIESGTVICASFNAG